MPVQLPLSEMTLAEKLEIMEAIWADISRRPVELPSPDWHRDVLAERKRQVAEGKLQFLDWEKAFADLRREVRGHSPS